MAGSLKTPSFHVLSTREAQPFFRTLWTRSRAEYRAFPGMDFYNRQLFAGNFRVLKERFDLRAFALVRETASAKTPVAVATHYRSRSSTWGEQNALGTLLFDPSVTDEELTRFHQGIGGALGQQARGLVGPVNGHMALGIALPDPGTDPSKISFLTSSSTAAQERFFTEGGRFTPLKRYHALRLSHSPEMEARLRSELNARPPSITARKLSFTHFKRDIGIYNRLVNTCMTAHPRFHPLTEAQDWDLMKMSFSVLRPEYFRFLMHQGREIAFCFGVGDYHGVFEIGGSDAANSLRALFYRKRLKRGRIIYSGILPEHRGSGLFKYVRHEVLLSMFDAGIREIESSYIDETNNASLGNVRSTGAELSHGFTLYQWK